MKKLSFNIFSKYREVLMGLAILSILIFHYTEDCYNASINYTGIVKLYKTYIGSSGVDIFLLLSGLGLYYSFSKNNNINDFYIKRIKRVIVPYLILAIPVYIWYDFIYLSDGIIYFLKNIFFITIFTNNNMLFWYIFFIIICYLIFPFIYKLINKSKDSMSIIKILSIIIVLIIGLFFINKFYPTFFSKTNIMLLRFIPFILGILLGKFSLNNKKIKYYIIIFILGLFSFLLVRFNLIYNRLFLFMFNLSIMFFIILIIDIISKKRDLVIKPFSFLGKYSLEIYLVHVAVRKIIITYGYHNYKIGYYLIFIIVSIIISILFNMLIKKVLRIKK